VNLAICIPARDEVHSGFAKDLAVLSAKWYASVPAGIRFDIHMVSGTLIADQRMKLVRMALDGGVDYILFLDSDMRFPSDVIVSLMRHDLDIVAANYATRRLPVKTVAFKNFQKLQYVTSDSSKAGLEEVDAVGMGCMLIKANVFRNMAEPWFQIGYSPDWKAYIGEDMYFCREAQKAGFKVYIDHDVSKQVRHIGVLEFMHEHVDL
jgi:hypothetical protein